MDPDVLLTQLYRVDTGDNATMRTGTVKAVYPIRGTIDVEVAGELLREIPYGAGLNPVIDSTVWLIEQGNWFAAISAAASSGQYAGVDEVLVGGEPPTASAVDLWMDTNNVGEGDGWAVLDDRYAQSDHSHGAGGGSGEVSVIDFPTPLASWVIDLGYLVDVVVTDSAGHVIWPGDVLYGPGTQVTLTFSAPFSGKVQCYP